MFQKYWTQLSSHGNFQSVTLRSYTMKVDITNIRQYSVQRFISIFPPLSARFTAPRNTTRQFDGGAAGEDVRPVSSNIGRGNISLCVCVSFFHTASSSPVVSPRHGPAESVDHLVGIKADHVTSHLYTRAKRVLLAIQIIVNHVNKSRNKSTL